MIIDSHAHLGSLEKTDDAVQTAIQNGVNYIINMSSDYTSALQTVEFTRKFPNVYGAVGIHPHEASSCDSETFSRIEELSQHEKIVAIGETGLDYYYHNSPRDLQIASLKQHIKLSMKSGKPIVIHMRDSDSDIKKIIGDDSCSDLKGVIHCFTGDYQTALYFIELGFYISFSGILTFNRSVELREVAKKIPIDKILVETDSPYLAPVPFRGKKNQPAYVKYIVQKLAEIRNEPFDKVSEHTAYNTRKLFKLPS
jgi:TatD DNase family protein